MKSNLENLKKLLKNKEIIVINTKQDKVAFELAHVLRDFSKVTYCVDKKYKIKENSEGYRKIEEGKVFLIKGDYDFDEEQIAFIIKKKLKGKPKYIFNITRIG